MIGSHTALLSRPHRPHQPVVGPHSESLLHSICSLQSAEGRILQGFCTMKSISRILFTGGLSEGRTPQNTRVSQATVNVTAREKNSVTKKEVLKSTELCKMHTVELHGNEGEITKSEMGLGNFLLPGMCQLSLVPVFQLSTFPPTGKAVFIG